MTTLFVQDNAICNATTFTDDQSLVTKQYLVNTIKNSFIIGEIRMYAGTVLPTGWLYCGGQSLDASANPQYSALFNVIGKTYGGTGKTNFYIPNLSQKMPIGSTNVNQIYINYQGDNSVVSSGNSNLSINQLPSHSHDMTHTHNYSWYYVYITPPSSKNLSPGVGDRVVSVGAPYNTSNDVVNSTTGISDAGTSQDSGGTTEFLPPFCVLNFIIFYGV
jgi:microcystin-dependent protein